MDERPSWDEYFIGIAQAVSARGDCRRSRVGCVVVSKDQRVLGVGYNGTAFRGVPGCLDGACPRGLLSYGDCPPLSSYENCIAVHAEENAIRWALEYVGENALQGASLYVTRGCCDDCSRLATSFGIDKIVTPEGVTFRPS